MARWVVLTVGMRLPGSARTLPELRQTSTGVFDRDCARLRERLQAFHERRHTTEWPANPAFGPLTGVQWGRLPWQHLDHHLRQFGV